MQQRSHRIWPARLESLYDALSFVSSCARSQGFGPERIGEIEIALEEVLVNIFKYAYEGKEKEEVEISCGEDDGNFMIEIADSGIPFNMVAATDPDLTAGIEERPIGGLGIFFVKQLMSEVRYRREGGRNRLTLVVFKNREKV